MSKILLRDIAQARSGDKGNTVNIGLFAPSRELYEIFDQQVTAEKVKEHFQELIAGEVIRYEVPTINAYNFILTGALNGGGSRSIRIDSLGKCFGANLLRMEIEVPEDVLKISNQTVNKAGV
ncbi:MULTISPECIES: hypothetical protein [unclassified Sporosarcina]|uniref:AtuA-related protein n=1 Tax=unclassified Sporosarcina TaxID=2647733 RepID=UPI000C169601|nr:MULTISPECIES: hypothetical protein [unclassified Sporosarcina]PID03860.1 hypothetical protein CSV66_15835 [Sporosarcina sp. P30]PID07872.1 hypothetical protein CSV65_13955 [Sporosarcina sp. P31]PID10668.1 hypothetical protein CSV64_15945 [Sporosarcina sp. P32b]